MGHRSGHACIDGTETLEQVADQIKNALIHMIPHNPARTVGLDADSVDLAIEDDIGNDWIVTVRRPVEA